MKHNSEKYIDELKERLNGYSFEMEKFMVQMRFMGEVQILMDKHKINKSVLAKGVETSPAFITQLFKGDRQLNIEMITKFQEFFDIKFDVQAKKDVTKPLPMDIMSELEESIPMDREQNTNELIEKDDSNEQQLAA